MDATDRRTRIADAAIAVVAGGGMRALTHRAVDTELGLPAGSTSYYFRTRRALVAAVADRIAETSRRDFAASALASAVPDDLVGLARGVAAWLDALLADRPAHLAVRYLLAVETVGEPGLPAPLFSRERATELFGRLGVAEPETAAADFIGVLEGLVFDRFAGARAHDGLRAGSESSIAQLARPIEAYLRGEHRAVRVFPPPEG